MGAMRIPHPLTWKISTRRICSHQTLLHQKMWTVLSWFPKVSLSNHYLKRMTGEIGMYIPKHLTHRRVNYKVIPSNTCGIRWCIFREVCAVPSVVVHEAGGNMSNVTSKWGKCQRLIPAMPCWLPRHLDNLLCKFQVIEIEGQLSIQ